MTHASPEAARAAILTVNAGSSSLKFALHPVARDQVLAASFSGVAEGLEPGGAPRLVHRRDGAPARTEALVPRDGETPHATALRGVVALLGAEARGTTLAAVAHRIVHGGARHAASVRLTPSLLDELEALSPLAPLHQPHNLAGVRAFIAALPDVPQVGCFDTAFHATLPEVEQRFALPESEFDAGVRRYGFHGLSYRYVSELLQGLSGAASGRMLLAHLGNGASLCAVRGGRSVATTMGFSALDGLMMGSRSGALDAGVLLHWLRRGDDAAAIEQRLYKRSGLLGVSGESADMRTLRASTTPAARRAIALFTHRVVRESGALAACLGGVDVLGFTGGIGEHDAALRADVCAALAHLGVALDEAANAAADGRAAVAVHAPSSRVQVWIVPTDEGRVAARDAWALVQRPLGVAPPAPACATTAA